MTPTPERLAEWANEIRSLQIDDPKSRATAAELADEMDPPKLPPRMPEPGDRRNGCKITYVIPYGGRWFILIEGGEWYWTRPGLEITPRFTTRIGEARQTLLDVVPELPAPAVVVDPEPVAWLVEGTTDSVTGVHLREINAARSAADYDGHIVPLYRRAEP